MPRDSSGNYTLPVGNPVIDGTVIDTEWANPTMSDIAVQLNNVITRDGLLSPINPMYFVDGTPALPGIAFAAAHGTGFWRTATQIGVSWQGVTKQTWSATGTTITGTISTTGILSADAGFNGTPDLILMSSGTEKARINAAGFVGIGAAPTPGSTLRLGKDLTGALSARALVVNGLIQSDATSATGIISGITTAAGPVALTSITHFQVSPPAFGSGSSVATQVGFLVGSTVTGAAINRAFQSNIDAATDRWNLYMSGTAANFLAGNTYVGMDTPDAVPSLSATPPRLQVLGTSISSATVLMAAYSVSSTSATLYLGKSRGVSPAAPVIVNNNDTLGSVRFVGSDGVVMQEAARILGVVNGAPSVGNVPGGLLFQTSTVGAPTTSMQINAAGEVGIPGASPGQSLRVTRPITGLTTSYGILSGGTVQLDVTTAALGVGTSLGAVAAAALPNLYHFQAAQGTFGGGAAVASQYGFYATSTLIGAANNYGFYGNLSAAAGRWNLYMAGTADNYLAGVLNIGTLTAMTTAASRQTVTINGAVSSALSFGANDVRAGYIIGDAARLAINSDTLLRISTASVDRIAISATGDIVSNVNVAVPALTVNNTMVFNLTSNTNLRVSVRGTDGVTRVANLTLA